MVKQSGLFSSKFGATSSHVFTQSPQNFAVEHKIHSLASWGWCFALPQLRYRRRHQPGIFSIHPRISDSLIRLRGMDGDNCTVMLTLSRIVNVRY
jgi:hypothetical protein